MPDHSSLTRIRTRYGLATFRRFFDQIVAQCRAAGLVWGRDLYLDATQVAANADRDAMVPCFYADAINAHLTTLFAPLAAGGNDTPPADEPSARDPLPLRPSSTNGEKLPSALPTRQDWFAELGRPDRSQTRGIMIARATLARERQELQDQPEEERRETLAPRGQQGFSAQDAQDMLAIMQRNPEAMLQFEAAFELKLGDPAEQTRWPTPSGCSWPTWA